MPPTYSADLSLINGDQFLDDPGSSHDVAGLTMELEAGTPAMYADAFEVLETGLPVDVRVVPEIEAPHHECAPMTDPYDAFFAPRPTLVDMHVPFMAAALVLVGCLTVGAATAALVLH
jgi:hypothetical protein